MENFEPVAPSITAPPGFVAGGVYCGIKTPAPDKRDLGVILAERECVVAGTFTQNISAAAPVQVCRERLRSRRGRGVVFNSGNANACTGEQGLADARAMADLAGARCGVPGEHLFVASTGVIGVLMPMDKVRAGMADLRPTREGGPDAASAMLTTDTRRKEIAFRFELGGRTVTMAGVAKGAAMIHPNMATMLCFVTTDAAVEADALQHGTSAAVAGSFNMISVDRDTSTNDTVLVFANGLAGNAPVALGSPDLARLQAALDHTMVHLARAIAQDGEGATALIEVTVRGGASLAEARRAAREVSASVLLKCAVTGADPNWGRVLMALGNSGVSYDPSRVDVTLGDVQVARGGLPVAFSEQAAAAALSGPIAAIGVDLHQGSAVATAWGCNLTTEYVRLNSEYTT